MLLRPLRRAWVRGTGGIGLVDEHEMDDRGPVTASNLCPSCGTPNRAGDRFCSQCGTRLPDAQPGEPRDILPPPPGSAPATTKDEEESRAWIFAARPAAVMGGGVLLLLLAAVLLLIGQREPTGTVVMLSFCLAPLGLLTIAIGLIRQVIVAAGRG
jgi:hypothetical protein